MRTALALFLSVCAFYSKPKNYADEHFTCKSQYFIGVFIFIVSGENVCKAFFVVYFVQNADEMNE